MSGIPRKMLIVIGLGLAATVLVAACQPSIAAAPPASTQTATPAPSGTSSLYPTYPAPAATLANNGTFTLMVANNPALGNILTDPNGMTLYTSKNDQPGLSNCIDSCAQTWLPLAAGGISVPIGGPGVTGQLGIITRPDSSLQVTYNGLPLYYYIGDKAPGEALGQGIDGIWFAARP